MHKRIIPVLLCFFLSTAAFARVVSYAPYTDRTAFASYNERTARHFVLVEWTDSWDHSDARVVLYDSQGQSEPKVIYPRDANDPTNVDYAAVYEDASSLVVMIQVYDAHFHVSTLVTRDSGATWTPVAALDDRYVTIWPFDVDLGGPFSRGNATSVRIGNAAYPFVVAAGTDVFAISKDGIAKTIASSGNSMALAGRNRAGDKFLVRVSSTEMDIVDLDGHATELPVTLDASAAYQGWITANGSVYLLRGRSEGRFLYTIPADGALTFIAGPYTIPEPPIGGPYVWHDPMSFFAVPTYDYEGAWMIQRDEGKPTTLSIHTRTRGLQKMWEDVSGPQVEALHAGSSGERLLIQVHRPRVQPERWFFDPALAVWKIGEAAPHDYDELFLNEGELKGFVHLDVETVASGATFVFDSAWQVAPPPDVIISPAPGGGSDVVQEWGVVRGSLKQRLVLPGVARLNGAFGSFWLTDVVIYNPLSERQEVRVKYVPLGEVQTETVRTTTIYLAPHEIRVVKDALKTLYGLDQAGGSLYIDPAEGVNVTSRTYSKQGEGTFGYGMQAIDLFASASPGFPFSFAGAFQGEHFRTNILITDTSGRGTEAHLSAFGTFGPVGSDTVSLTAPVFGVTQTNGVASVLSLPSSQPGGLLVRPTRGTAVATVVSIDNRTNDPTYFPPDLPAPFVRTIPVVGHLDGAHGAKFRSDLYLMNLSDQPRTVNLEAKKWDTNDMPVNVPFTLLPNEARMIPDVLQTLFNLQGVARLRYQSPASGDIRATSRTYTVEESGATYGSLIPPLNNFQSAASGEALEIVGVVGNDGFRTNIGLVDLTPRYNSTQARARIDIIDDRGTELDSFEVAFSTAGGMQINDVFTARGITPPPAALIRITPFAGLIGAYATLTDNVTNDTTFIGANLAAQP